MKRRAVDQRATPDAPGRPVGTARWILLGMLTVLAWAAPAHWATGLANSVLEKALKGRLALVAPAGRLWEGSAQLAVGDGQSLGKEGFSYKTLPLGVTWQLPARCGELQATLCAQVTFEGGSPQAVLLGLSMSGVHVGAGQLNVQARWLKGLGMPWTTLQPEGTVSVAWPADPSGVTVRWLQAQSALTSVRPLGDYVAQVQRNGRGEWAWTLNTDNGALQLTGAGSFSPSGEVLGTLQARAVNDKETALAPLLASFGKKEGDAYRLK